jgi:hypothetical protein
LGFILWYLYEISFPLKKFVMLVFFSGKDPPRSCFIFLGGGHRGMSWQKEQERNGLCKSDSANSLIGSDSDYSESPKLIPKFFGSSKGGLFGKEKAKKSIIPFQKREESELRHFLNDGSLLPSVIRGHKILNNGVIQLDIVWMKIISEKEVELLVSFDDIDSLFRAYSEEIEKNCVEKTSWPKTFDSFWLCDEGEIRRDKIYHFLIENIWWPVYTTYLDNLVDNASICTKRALDGKVSFHGRLDSSGLSGIFLSDIFSRFQERIVGLERKIDTLSRALEQEKKDNQSFQADMNERMAKAEKRLCIGMKSPKSGLAPEATRLNRPWASKAPIHYCSSSPQDQLEI